MALTLNPQYTKALLRRAKAFEALKHLSKALVDVTAACILENFQNHSTMLTADRILKELGRQHAREAITNKKPVTPSVYFIKTYFSSFEKDPLASFIADEAADASKYVPIRVVYHILYIILFTASLTLAFEWGCSTVALVRNNFIERDILTLTYCLRISLQYPPTTPRCVFPNFFSINWLLVTHWSGFGPRPLLLTYRHLKNNNNLSYF